MVFPPQTGTHSTVTIPSTLPPSHEALAGLEPLGWVHTQPRELPSLPPSDALAHAKLLGAFPSWSLNSSIILSVAFTPGSASLAAFRLTSAGADWGKGVLKDAVATGAIMGGGAAPGFTPQLSAKAPLLLSERFLGSVLVPAQDGVWNYNFQGVRFSDKMTYQLLVVPSPLPFFAEEHRSNHFVSFNAPAVGADTAGEDAELRGADAFA